MDSASNPLPARLNATASASANTQARQVMCTIWILAIMPCVRWMNWLNAVEVIRERSSVGGARRRMPAFAIRDFLEVGGRDVRSSQILRILHDLRDDQPRVAVRRGLTLVVFGQHRRITVWGTVLAQIPWLEPRGHRFERTAGPGG